jgi:hypothetical protein
MRSRTNVANKHHFRVIELAGLSVWDVGNYPGRRRTAKHVIYQ